MSTTDTPSHQPDMDAVRAYFDSGMAVLELLAHEQMDGSVPRQFASLFWAGLYSLRQAKQALGD